MSARGARVARTRLRVRYAETDQMRVAYYANYLVWFEVGRTDWLREADWSYRQMENEGLALPVIEAHCEYQQSARYDDELEVRTRARLVSPLRIRFDYEVVRAGGDRAIATGHTVHVTVDAEQRPVRLPARVRELLT